MQKPSSLVLLFLLFSGSSLGIPAPVPEALPAPIPLAEPAALPEAQPLALPNPRLVDEAGGSCDAKCQTDSWLFTASLDGFNTELRKKWTLPKTQWAGIDWIKGTDGCSVPKEVVDGLKINKDKPYGFEFLNSCYRHDFGYGNYKQQSRFTEANRGKIDDNFKQDMLDTCDAKHKDTLRIKWTQCVAVAELYWTAVRGCGDGKCERLVNNIKKLMGGIDLNPFN